MLPARILAWYPKAALGAGFLEALVAHEDRGISRRLLKLLRMQVSFCASCPFCIDMNSAEFEKEGIGGEEIEALQGRRALEEVASFSEEERLALMYAREVTSTPIALRKETVTGMKTAYSERQFVIIASTIAQVNYWTRLIQSLGIPPAGFSETCDFLRLEDYTTLR
jgi:alkylhydroperoxidase family enzyme